jgi:hypothetical protein
VIRCNRLWSDLTGFIPVHLGQRIVSLAVIWPFMVETVYIQKLLPLLRSTILPAKQPHQLSPHSQ